MSEGTDEKDARSSATTGPKQRLHSLDDLDRRTKAARAAFDLRDRIQSDLGGADAISAMEGELVNNVSVMGAMFTDLAARYLSGKPVDLAEFATLTNAQRRLLSDLGLQRRSRDVTPTLDQYLRENYGQQQEPAE